MRNASIIIGVLVGLCACTDEPATSSDEQAIDSSYADTRYPIVLLPGLFGFDQLLGFVDYFPGIPEALASGGARVYVAYGSKTNSSEARAAQIIPQLEDILAITGAARVNLIGHSQGGLDARVIAARRPDLVASVTTVGSPHRGAKIATLVDSGALGPLPDLMLGALADLMTLLSGSDDPNDVAAAMHTLSRAGADELNARYPAAVPGTACGQGAAVVGGIPYWSWGGVGTLTNPVDLLDSLWVVASLIADERNDGLVGRCSAHLGTVLRDDYPHNHLDETNMLFGLVNPIGARPQAIFRAHANRLVGAGL